MKSERVPHAETGGEKVDKSFVSTEKRKYYVACHHR
jgi:hypothetical protein